MAPYARDCEVCGTSFRPTYQSKGQKQRTCSRPCGRIVRSAPYVKRGKTCKVYFPTCTCGKVFAARNSRHKLCSYRCRINDTGSRLRDLYRMAARQGAAGARWRNLLVGYLRERDGDRCPLCRKTIRFDLKSGPRGDRRGPSVDHVVPRSQGGSDDPANLRLTCWGCNHTRSAKGGGEQLALIG